MSADTVNEAIIFVAALRGEQFSDNKPSIATCFTVEFNGELVGSAFHVLDRIHHNHRALLHSLRAAISFVPTSTTRVTITSSFERLIRYGSSGELPTDHRRNWQDVRFQLAHLETIWKLADGADERQRALIRCLRNLLQDPSLAGPRLVTPSRRRRKAAIGQQSENSLSTDDSIRHSNVISKVEASAEDNVLPWPQSHVGRQAAEVA